MVNANFVIGSLPGQFLPEIEYSGQSAIQQEEYARFIYDIYIYIIPEILSIRAIAHALL